MIDLPLWKLYHADRVTVAEISVVGRKDTKMQRITADLISDKTHTSVAFVDNYCKSILIWESKPPDSVKLAGIVVF